MSALAQFIMRGRSQAILVVSAFTVLSWLLSVASLLAAAALALPTLRLGIKEGLFIGACSLPIVALAGYGVMGGAVEAVGFALVIWAPTVLVAQVLRDSGRLSVALMSTVGIGMTVVTGFYLMMEDPAAFWRNQFGVILQPMLEAQMSASGEGAVGLTLDLFARYATGAVSAGSTLSVLASLLIARWWQAGLYNPGGFRKEFLALRLSKLVSSAFLILVALTAVLAGEAGIFLANFELPALMGFMLAGFAVLHSICGVYPSGRFWLMGIYLALMFMTPLILVIALLGVSDAWLDWRKRFSGSKAY